MLYDKNFKSISLKIGIALLVHLGLSSVFVPAITSVSTAMFSEIFNESVTYYVSEILYGILYLIAFGLPAIILRMISSDEAREPLTYTKTPVGKKFMLVFAAITVVFCFSQINTMIVSLFDAYDHMTGGDTSGVYSIGEILVLIFTLAVVPALCEEFLFRATILRLLAPYSRSFAVIASALCFGLMHRNPIQILYATAAGIVIGFIYLKTGSYFWAFLTHFVNNLIAVAQSVLFGNLDEVSATRAFVIIESIVIITGIISGLVLILGQKKKGSPHTTGSFGVILDASDSYRERPCSISLPKRFFTTPTLLIFLILCVIDSAAILLFPNLLS